MNLKVMKFHPCPEIAAKEVKPTVLSVPPNELLATVLSNMGNVRGRDRKRRKEEKWS